MTDTERARELIPLVFHFTGNRVPAWGSVTLKQAPNRWPGPVVFLHDRLDNPTYPGVQSVEISKWYNKRPFQSFADNFARPTDFRNGFWFHAVERFFVLSQWAEYFNVPRFLHTELDVALFEGDQLEANLSLLPQGLFFPRASQKNAGANFLYVSGRASLKPLLQFFISNSGEEYEMGLLARFLDEEQTMSNSLPSHFDFEEEFPTNLGANRISLSELGGVVDVHPIGTWILGQDPRNEPSGPVYNHYYYQNIGTPELANLKYRYSLSQKQLLVRKGVGPEWPVFALHVHSKLTRLVSLGWAMAVLTWLANRSFKTLLIPQNLTRYVKSFLQRVLNLLYLKLIVPTRRRIRRS